MQSVLHLSQRSTWAEGQPISRLMARALAAKDLITLAAGFVDLETLPTEATHQAIEAIFSDSKFAQSTLQYGATMGDFPLRQRILERFLADDGTTVEESSLSIDQIVITAGSNQLLHLVSECILDSGDIVLCAAPTYLVFLGTLANIGARAIGVATDSQGICPEALEEMLQQLDSSGELERVKALYLVTYFDNPCGTTLSKERRAQIVEIVERWSRQGKILIIEDMAYRDLRYQGEEIPSLRSYDSTGETVVVAGTFSKSFSPGIRVGWGILPRDLVGPVCNLKGNIDFGSPNFAQQVIAKVLELDLLDAHIERIRQGYRKKLVAMLAAADEYLSPLPGVSWQKPDGGLYVWLQLPPECEAGPSGQLFDLALNEGMFYVPGEYCYPGEGQAVCKNTIRLSFGVQSCEKIKLGIAGLARAIGKIVY